MSGLTDFLYRRRVELVLLVCMDAVYFFSFFQRVAVPGTIFDELQSDFAASAGAVALLGGIYLYLYGGMQVFAGLLNDRFGAVKILLTGGLLLSLGSLAFPLSPSLPILYASRTLVGLGASLIYLSIVKAINSLFGAEHFAQFLGVSMFLGYSGGLAGTFPFERAVNAWGWRHALLGAGVLCSMAVGVAVVLFRKSRRVEHRENTASFRTVAKVLGNRSTLPLLISSPWNFAIYFLVQAVLGKKFLLDYGKMSSGAAASFTCLMMLVTMCTGLAGPFLSRCIGNRRKPILIASLLCTVAAVALILVGLRWDFGGGWFLACYILLASMSIGAPLGAALMKELNPPEAIGTSTGILNGACYIAVALLTSLSGWIMDLFTDSAVKTATAVVYPKQAYTMIFLVCLGLGLLSLFASFFLRESHGKDTAPADLCEM